MRRKRRRRVKRTGGVRDAIRLYLEMTPEASPATVADAVGCSRAYATTQIKAWREELTRASTELQRAHAADREPKTRPTARRGGDLDSLDAGLAECLEVARAVQVIGPERILRVVLFFKELHSLVLTQREGRK